MPVYTDKVMDHFENPRNVGEIEGADGVGTVGNAVCGDIMKIFIKVEDNKIVEAKFKTVGCGAAIATSSMATEMVVGKTIEEALAITREQVADELVSFVIVVALAIIREESDQVLSGRGFVTDTRQGQLGIAVGSVVGDVL